MHIVELPLPKGRGRKTEQLQARQVGTYLIVLRELRSFVVNPHPWSRGPQREAPLGPVYGYQLLIEDADGITLYLHETRDRADAEARYARAVARASGAP